MSIKVGVIGCGWVADACHGPAYIEYASQHPDIELTACCDIDSAKVERFQEKFGFKRSYTDYFQMLDEEKPDAVCLTVPERLICEAGCKILARGIPLLCEKPPGLTVTEIDRLISAARASRVIHLVAFNRRFTPLVAELKRRVEGQAIHHIHYEFTRVGRGKEDFSTTAVHAIDTVRYLVGSDYRSVRFHYQELPEEGQKVTNTLMDCTFGSEATASINIKPVAGVNIERAILHLLDNTYILHCNNGPDAPGRLLHYQKGQLLYDISGADYAGSREDFMLNGFYAENASFFEAVRSRTQPVHDFQSCRQSVELMQSMRERKLAYHSRSPRNGDIS